MNGAHAWAVYTDMNGEDYIVDPANKYVGTRADSLRAKGWRYLVPLDE